MGRSCGTVFLGLPLGVPGGREVPTPRVQVASELAGEGLGLWFRAGALARRLFEVRVGAGVGGRVRGGAEAEPVVRERGMGGRRVGLVGVRLLVRERGRDGCGRFCRGVRDRTALPCPSPGASAPQGGRQCSPLLTFSLRRRS